MNHSFDVRKETPLVSVTVITYNHLPYIEECLDGILMQQTNFPFEVIVHDDASTDGTADIVRAYADKYPNVIIPILQKENQYSQGKYIFKFFLSMIRGKYRAHTEGDDYWIDPKKLQMQVDALEAHPECSLCFHNATVIYDRGRRAPHPFGVFQRELYTIEDVIEKWFVPSPSVMIRQSMAGQQPWEQYVLNSDYVRQLILALNGPFFCINKDMCVYRRHHTSLSSSVPAHVMTLKTVQAVDYFDMYTDFKYHDLIQSRIQRRTKDLYKECLYQRPLWAKFLSVDYYRFKLESALSAVWKKNR